jgi:hypothetical protein
MSETSEIKEVLKLRKPITVHGKNGAEKISELKLKEPSGRLMLHKGLPFTVLTEISEGSANRVEVRINPSLALEYLVEMSGHDALILEQLSAVDVRAAHLALTRMLNPTEA